MDKKELEAEYQQSGKEYRSLEAAAKSGTATQDHVSLGKGTCRACTE